MPAWTRFLARPRASATRSALSSAYSWDGAAWTAQTLPSAASSGNPARGVVHVAEVLRGGRRVQQRRTLSRWLSGGTAQPGPRRPPRIRPRAHSLHENAVSCASASACEAGGDFQLQMTSNDPKAFAEGWNGSAWQLQSRSRAPRRHRQRSRRGLLPIGDFLRGGRQPRQQRGQPGRPRGNVERAEVDHSIGPRPAQPEWFVVYRQWARPGLVRLYAILRSGRGRLSRPLHADVERDVVDASDPARDLRC